MLPAATTATAAYNADNQLTNWNGATIAYDLNGNLTGDGTRSFTWDARNRLTGITGVASFVYDGVGRRQSATQGATTTTALYDGYDPVQEQVPTGTVSANLQIGLGTDQRFTRTKGGVTSTYLTDLLGSTVALSDSSGVVQTSYGYDPYGVTSQTGAANDNPYQFTGRQNDNTGLYYYRARYYNPAWGRFISEDPIGLAGGINQYAYSNSDPVSFSDPFGLGPTTWHDYLLPPLPSSNSGGACYPNTGYPIGPEPHFPKPAASPSIEIGPVMSSDLPRGFWPGPAGAAEWGRRNGVGAAEGKRRFHQGTKQGDNMSKPKDKYGVNPDTGDVVDPSGDIIGNLND